MEIVGSGVNPILGGEGEILSLRGRGRSFGQTPEPEGPRVGEDGVLGEGFLAASLSDHHVGDLGWVSAVS